MEVQNRNEKKVATHNKIKNVPNYPLCMLCMGSRLHCNSSCNLANKITRSKSSGFQHLVISEISDVQDNRAISHGSHITDR